VSSIPPADPPHEAAFDPPLRTPSFSPPAWSDELSDPRYDGNRTLGPLKARR
jgi:hypothetical protein